MAKCGTAGISIHAHLFMMRPSGASVVKGRWNFCDKILSNMYEGSLLIKRNIRVPLVNEAFTSIGKLANSDFSYYPHVKYQRWQ